MPPALYDLLTRLQYRKCHRRSEIFPVWLLARLRKGGTTAEEAQREVPSRSRFGLVTDTRHSRVQRPKAWRGPGVRLLQAHRECRGRKGHALPGPYAGHLALARYHQDRQDAKHEQVRTPHLCPMLHGAAGRAVLPPNEPTPSPISLDNRIRSVVTNVNRELQHETRRHRRPRVSDGRAA